MAAAPRARAQRVAARGRCVRAPLPRPRGGGAEPADRPPAGHPGARACAAERAPGHRRRVKDGGSHGSLCARRDLRPSGRRPSPASRRDVQPLALESVGRLSGRPASVLPDYRGLSEPAVRPGRTTGARQLPPSAFTDPRHPPSSPSGDTARAGAAGQEREGRRDDKPEVVGAVQAAARSYARSQGTSSTARPPRSGNVMKIRFYPFMPVAAERHAHHRRGRQRVPRPDRRRRCRRRRLRPSAHPPGDRRSDSTRCRRRCACCHPRRRRPSSSRSVWCRRSRRLRQEGLVRRVGLGCPRLLAGGAGGGRAAAPRVVHRRPPREDRRLGRCSPATPSRST